MQPDEQSHPIATRPLDLGFAGVRGRLRDGELGLPLEGAAVSLFVTRHDQCHRRLLGRTHAGPDGAFHVRVSDDPEAREADDVLQTEEAQLQVIAETVDGLHHT